MSKEVKFNTGRRYSEDGQRIIAKQAEDGTVVFRDIDRHVSGVLTERSSYCGADPGPAMVFPQLSEGGVQSVVMERYCNGYSFKSSAEANRLKGE